MKIAHVLTALSFALSSAAAMADGPVLPQDRLGDNTQACVGPACASVVLLDQNYGFPVPRKRVIVSYEPSRGHLGSNVSMGALLNGKPVSVTINDNRGGRSFLVDLPTDASGDLAIYFLDDQGHYDSDFGKNFHFTLN